MLHVCATCRTAYHTDWPRFGCACGRHAAPARRRRAQGRNPSPPTTRGREQRPGQPPSATDWQQLTAQIVRRTQLRQWQRWGTPPTTVTV
ncbi:MAG: hypothetical protein HY689_12355 [Chloroflexi bacterium]|nr:hypothetical protein [Chloroflexota bacterium]